MAKHKGKKTVHVQANPQGNRAARRLAEKAAKARLQGKRIGVSNDGQMLDPIVTGPYS